LGMREEKRKDKYLKRPLEGKNERDMKRAETRGRMERDNCIASEPQGGEGERRERN